MRNSRQRKHDKCSETNAIEHRTTDMMTPDVRASRNHDVASGN